MLLTEGLGVNASICTLYAEEMTRQDSMQGKIDSESRIA